MRHVFVVALTLVVTAMAAGCGHVAVANRSTAVAATSARCTLPSELAVDCACTRPDCLLKLGFIYSEGIDVVRDDGRARDFLSRACAGGSTLACNDLASLLYAGRGGPADATRAADLYEAACRRHDAVACVNLGTLYLDGRGRPADDLVAALLFQQSCKEGVTHACASLAMLYVHGDGVPVDVHQAVKLFEESCVAGDIGACEALDVFAQARSINALERYIRNLHLSCGTGDAAACVRLR